jgi:glutamate-1-semialdehyde 2,1-aminomutase
LRSAAEDAGIDAAFTRVGSMSCMFFTGESVVDYTSAKSSDTERYAAYFRGMLERGTYLAPSQFEATFVSTAHSEEQIDETVEAARQVMAGL